ncbi:cupin domain-containing protein [Neiella litorisoli]|nr:cupin domain-containing protein [Neiella litorisoli]
MNKRTYLAAILSASMVVGVAHGHGNLAAKGYSSGSAAAGQQQAFASSSAYFIADNVEWEDVGSGIKRKILPYSDGLMGVVVSFEKGAVGEVHTHDVHDQLATIIKGSFEVDVGGVKHVVKQGDSFLAGKGVPHGVVALEEDSQIFDTFNPHRASFVGSGVEQKATGKAAKPVSAFFFDSKNEWESVGDGITRKILPYTEGIMGVQVKFDKGAVGAVHTHDIHDQLAICLKGSFEIDLNGVKTIIKQGDAFLALKGSPHGVVALEQDSMLLDTFNPYRADFVGKKQ